MRVEMPKMRMEKLRPVEMREVRMQKLMEVPKVQQETKIAEMFVEMLEMRMKRLASHKLVHYRSQKTLRCRASGEPVVPST